MPNDKNDKPLTDDSSTDEFFPVGHDDTFPPVTHDDLQPIPNSTSTTTPVAEDIVNDSPATSSSSGSAAPVDDVVTSTVSSNEPRKKYGGGKGKFIATILGLLLLVGGSVAGLQLVKQNQNIEEKASCVSDCVNLGVPESVCRQQCGSSGQCVPGSRQNCSTGGCNGTQTCQGSGTSTSWGSCVKNDPSCGTGTTCTPNARRCVSSSTIETCNSAGSGWIQSYCQYGCLNNACNTTPAVPSCSSVGATGNCSTSPVGGATYCSNTNGTSRLYCCQAGKEIINGSCVASNTRGTCEMTSGQACVKASSCTAPYCTTTGANGTCTGAEAGNVCAKITPVSTNGVTCTSATQGVAASIGVCCVPGGGTSYNDGTGNNPNNTAIGQPWTGTHWTTCAAGYTCQQGKGCFSPGGATPPPPTCQPLYYCNTTTYSCVQTSNPYHPNSHIQCDGTQTNTCEQNIQLYAPGTVLPNGQCYTSQAGCLAGCVRPKTPTPKPTPTKSPSPKPTPTKSPSPRPTATPTRTPSPTPTRSATPAPTRTPTVPPTTAPTAICYNIKAYDTNWSQLSNAQLAMLKPGDRVKFTVEGQASSGNFTRARFTINGTTRPEVTAKKSGSNEFYDEYTIPSNGTTTFTIGGQVFHESLGWR